ncbi:MAG: NAD-glutamate dehydrogenase [Pseudomonadota bacterium]|nr:NAD-glutamate dehydrogenase [Pseudomonadota bacterium]
MDTKALRSGGLKLNIGEPVPPESAYGAQKIGNELASYIDEVADTVRIGFDQSIAILTPWFFNNMPDVYYQTTPKAEKIKHLSTIITGHVFETKQTVELWNREHDKVTYIGPGNDRTITLDMAHRLAMVRQRVKMGFLYFSRDNLLFLSSFSCQKHKPVEKDNSRITEKIEGARKILHKEFSKAKDQVNYFLKHLDNDFVMYATVARIQLTYHMVHYMLMHEGAHTTLHRIKDSSLIRLTLGVKGIEAAQVFEQILSLFHRYGFSIVRSFLVNFDQHYREPISVVNFALDIDRSRAQKDTVEVSLIKLNKALRTLGWVDTDAYSSLGQQSFSINSINLVRSIADWTHVILSKRNFHYYSKHKVKETFFQHIELLKQVVRLFRLRFDPLLERQQAQQDYEQLQQELAAEIAQLADTVERDIFTESVHFIDNLLKTNYFLPTKTGLAFRLSPAVLDKQYYPHEPFGIFFIVGLGYRFFHMRWKDISRGGVRVIAPRTTSDVNIALSGLFDEVYGLSHAQQLKNKDIPEGGSKGVLLIRPEIDKERAIHGAINAFLDLLVSMDESHENQISQQVRYYNDDEIIYLGPDENVSDTMIEWIAAQAHRRGYRYANAFVSSKPKDGINHKRYAVTSEGLNVFVEHTLKQLDIDFRNQPFSVTMTGGPDGDVAGNELLILHREYGEHARVKAISDGKGVAYDPQGLNWQELLRLCRKGESIYAFDKGKVSEQGYVLSADTQENIKLRNEMPMKIEADIFIPAGGRPYTINTSNCSLFWGDDDQPTKQAIVEGANIFFTSEARDILQQKGILIIKDSSANKGGVICSSYEVLASLLLEPVEFAAIKDQYVKEVIAILRDKAAQEAKLLMREYVAHGRKTSLVSISMEISKQINSLKNLILEHFIAHPDELEKNDIYRQLILDNCPPVLVSKYSKRVINDLPQAHKLAKLASVVASNVVYREGIGWIDGLSASDRLQVSLVYVNQEQLTADFIAQVEGSSLRDKQRIADVLRAGATRNLTMMELIDRL